ncbi:chemotaxis protein CheB [Desulfopila aestuarii]|nr:chemotaxis protein CheB [Desulfopila aestuarii]
MAVAKTSSNKGAIPVLVADDSIVFRRYLRDILADFETITIGGEAKNGIEALDMVLKVRPKVILMDMEMPLMDGMTALQHLMIHCPTPTIMFSSLTSEGTFRAFDALKNGAVDFISKDLLFDESRQDVFKKMLFARISSAAKMKVHSIEPVFDMSKMQDDMPKDEPVTRVIFCEECGARNIVEGIGAAYCSQCGDVLVEYHDVEIFRRNTHVTIFGGGEDSCRNLLNIIPRLGSEQGGSTIVVIKADSVHVDTLTEYLDAISPLKILRAREGMSLDSGYCYVASTQDQICLQQFSTQQTLGKVKQSLDGMGSIDMAMASVAAAFKRKCAGVLLSGNELDGVRGAADIAANGGEVLVLNPDECLSPRLIGAAIEKIKGVRIATDENELARMLMEFCRQARTGDPIF